MLPIDRSMARVMSVLLALLVVGSAAACDAVLGIRVYPADAGLQEAAVLRDGGNDARTARGDAGAHREAGRGNPDAGLDGGPSHGCATPCGDAGCVDLQTDPTHCGGCGTNCTLAVNVSSAACSAGQCTYTCASGYVSNGACPGTADAAGCPVSLASASHCGSCSTQCMASAPNCTPTEDGGSAACTLTCSGSLSNCGGSCVDLQTSPSNCGTCMNVCSSFGCIGGMCAVCSPGSTECSGDGIATCGADGQWQAAVACGGGQMCCTPGGTPTCIDVESDPNNCGRCNFVCTGQQSCSNGIVTPAPSCVSGGCSAVAYGCGAYSCNGNSCNTACTVGDDNCAPNYECYNPGMSNENQCASEVGKCVLKAGQPCSVGACQCQHDCNATTLRCNCQIGWSECAPGVNCMSGTCG
jgi:hypothetical protein